MEGYTKSKNNMAAKFENERVIPEYTIPYKVPFLNNERVHQGGYVNYFNEKHPTTQAPHWYFPCFNGKQISVNVKKFN